MSKFFVNQISKLSCTIHTPPSLVSQAQHILLCTEFGYKPVYNQLVTTHYMTTNKIIHVYFNHMTYFMNHVTSLNNTCRWSYKLSCSGLQQTGYKPNRVCQLFYKFFVNHFLECNQTSKKKKKKNFGNHLLLFISIDESNIAL